MNQSFAVLGLGRFGRKVADALIDGNADVLVADRDEEIVNQYSASAASAIVAELSDEKALRSMGIGSVDVVILAMGENLEASILSAMVAKELGVPRVLAKASSRRMGEILMRVGADEIIYPEEEAAFRTAKKLLSDTFLDYYDLGDTLSLVEMRPRKEWIGKTLKELELREKFKLNVVAVREKGGAFVHISADIPLTVDAEMLIVAEKDQLNKLDGK